MSCPILRWPIQPDCPKCGNAKDEDILITDLAVERIGRLIVSIFCNDCKSSFEITYSIPRMLYEAEIEDEKIATAPRNAHWHVHCKPTVH